MTTEVSYEPKFSTQMCDEYISNGARFETRGEAEAYAVAMKAYNGFVEGWKVCPSHEPANSAWDAVKGVVSGLS